jgi:hypothetical protein
MSKKGALKKACLKRWYLLVLAMWFIVVATKNIFDGRYIYAVGCLMMPLSYVSSIFEEYYGGYIGNNSLAKVFNIISLVSAIIAFFSIVVPFFMG